MNGKSRSNFNIFKTEENNNQDKKDTMSSYSKEKYQNNFSSNIFFKVENKENASTKIKVNRMQKEEFVPKYKNKEMNSLQRKISQLQGSSSGFLSCFTNSRAKSVKSNKDDSNFPASSIGYYKKEQEVGTKIRDTCTAKERYYVSLSNSNPFNSKENKAKISERCNSMKNIGVNSQKISQMDNEKVEYKNSSRQFLFDNLYSNKIFHNNVNYFG